MKKLFLVVVALFTIMLEAQESKLVPQISVSGEGKIKVVPDKAILNFGIKTVGKEAAEVKKLNDDAVDKVLKFIKKIGIAANDFQTTQVSLNRDYDYDKKKYNFNASQSITIILKDLSKYDNLMIGLIDNGVNNITNVVFESSKIESLKSDARKLAITEAKHKADDYVFVLGQKVGKAILINDNNTPSYNPQPMYKTMAKSEDDGTEKQTIAIGEIEIIVNVTVSFLLE